MEYTESQSGYESAAGGQFDDAPEDVEKSMFLGSSSSNTTTTTTEVNSILNVQRKRNHEVMMEGNHEVMMEGKQTASEVGGPESGGKMPKRQSLLPTVMAWTKTLDDIFLKPARNSPNISNKDSVVGPESTGELSIPTACGDPVDDASKGEVDQGKKLVTKKWDQRLEELKAYKDRNGHVNPQLEIEYHKYNAKPGTKGLPEADLVLAKWVISQRSTFRAGNLENEKVGQLLALGCTGFDEPKLYKPVSWDQRFEDLRAYKERTGRANPPKRQGIPKADFVLASWLSNQRRRFRKGTMGQEKVDQLVALGCRGFGVHVNYYWEQPT